MEHKFKSLVRESSYPSWCGHVFNRVSDAVYVYDPDTFEIIDANIATSKIYGYSSEELIGMSCLKFSAEADKVIKQDTAKKTDGEITLRVRHHKRKDGSDVYVKIRRYIIPIENRELTLAIAENITDALIVEKTIQRNEEKFSTIFNKSLSMICVADIGTATFTFINPAFNKILGYSNDELLNKPFLEFIHPDDVEPTTEVIDTKLKSGTDVFRFENRYRCKDNTYRWLDWNAFPKPKDGLIYSIAHDITDRKRFEEALKVSEANLQELNASKDKFFSIISHDLRSPFNGILGLSKMGIEKIKKQDYKAVAQYLEQIHNTSEMSISLLDNILQWSNLQSGRIKYEPSKLTLSSAVERVIRLMEAPMKKKGIKISNEIDDDLLVFTDPFILETIIRNLLSNAIKYSHNNGLVRISVVVKDSELLMLIQDHGIGISKENLTKLFSIDSGYSTPGTQKEEGTGLGLNLCKELVELQGGKIWVESEEGKGSIFFFTVKAE